ncbi:MAG: DUF3857 domain-containing protein [Bryobacteraceae bacterium]
MKSLWLVLAAVAVCAAQDVPGWAREAAALPVPAYPAKVSAVVLLQEEHVTVEPDGKRVMRERGVVRALQQSRESAAATRAYNGKSGKIREFQGWIIPPKGKAFALPKNAVADRALATSSTYDEHRMKVLDPGTAFTPGSVFAYEVIEEERTIFTQNPYRFQYSEPVLISRLIVTVPQGWEIKGEPINAPELEPSVSGNTYTWEMRNLPWIEPEDYAPGPRVLAPRLGVSFYSPGGMQAGQRPLKDWSSVSAWLSGFVDPPAAVTAAIRSKAAELTASASTKLDKIRAIAAYAQQTNYVSIQMNLTRGGGYTPNPADQVLARNYGDCKDKSTLVRALLAAAGIDSYATVIYWGEREYVRPEWVSPHLFNHMIVTVKAPEDVDLPTAFDHPRLGRLLPFDPTDPYTPLGDLPRDQQGSRALVVAGEKGELLEMPLLPPSAHRVESTTEAEYTVDGSLSAKVVRSYFGQPAARLRRLHRMREPDRFKKGFEAGLTNRLGGLSMSRIEAEDRMEEGRFRVEMDLSVARFGQIQGPLLILSPGLLAPTAEYSFSTRERKTPVELAGGSRKDRVTIHLPAGLKVDELPKAVEIETSFGSYRAEWSYEDGRLTFVQESEVRDALIPAGEYPKVRAFFEAVNGAQGAPAILLTR